MPIYEGTSVEEAIQTGLSTLILTKENAQISVLDEGKKGFLGMGKKPARVKVEPKEELTAQSTVLVSEPVQEEKKETQKKNQTSFEEEEIVEMDKTDEQVLVMLGQYLTDISKALQAPAVVTFTHENNQTMVHLQTDKQGLLIGKHGKTLNALQYLAQVYVHRLTKNKQSIVLNVGEYREKREVILHRLAERTAEKVMKTGRPIFLEPMPAFERKQIHAALSKNQAIQTHSEGEEPYRYLVVELVNK